MSSGHDIRYGRLRALRGERGISLVEGLIAMTLFVIVATALVGVLTAGIASHGLSREKTIAQQAAAEEIEDIRRRAYADVGIVNGNPPGTVTSPKTISKTGLKATMTTQVSYVNDPTPSSYATLANYKKVIVTVVRDGDSKELTRQVTYIAPTARAPYGGLNNAIVNVLVTDYKLNQPVPGVLVSLKNGPSSNRSDTTDTAGRVTFPSLTPTQGAQYYDVEVPTSSGYETLSEDLPPSTAARFTLAPSQTRDTALRVYKPATIYVSVKDSLGLPYVGTATVYVGSPRQSETFTVTGGGPITIGTLGGEKIVPGLVYSVSARTALNQFSPVVSQTVPNDYPTDLTSTFVVQLSALPYAIGPTRVRVRNDGDLVPYARVDVTGGPIPTYLTGTTDANGEVELDIPQGTNYTITAWDPSGSPTGQRVDENITGSPRTIQVDIGS
jgi:type II secretory pathway pseudopilin PulG